VRYFTHYLPSPRSRLRAVYDAQDCVEAVIPSPRSRLRAVYDAQDCVAAVIG